MYQKKIMLLFYLKSKRIRIFFSDFCFYFKDKIKNVTFAFLNFKIFINKKYNNYVYS